MAEAESFKGKQTYSLTSSASGIFHFTGNGGGQQSRRKKRTQASMMPKEFLEHL
jgi:hypothetical protein